MIRLWTSLPGSCSCDCVTVIGRVTVLVSVAAATACITVRTAPWMSVTVNVPLFAPAPLMTIVPPTSKLVELHGEPSVRRIRLNVLTPTVSWKNSSAVVTRVTTKERVGSWATVSVVGVTLVTV